MLETAKKIAPGQYDRLVAEYEKLFIDVLGSAVFANTRSISYTPSSTGNGWLTLNFSADPLHPFAERYNNKTAGHIYGNRESVHSKAHKICTDEVTATTTTIQPFLAT